MTQKLTMHTTIQRMMTGHKLKWLLFGLFIICLNGCRLFHWDEFEPYGYNTIIHNATGDTLKIVFGTDTTNYFTEKALVFPDSSYDYKYGEFGLNDDEDPVRDGLFKEKNRLTDQVRVYKKDSLMIDWQGPPREMGDSIHHIFNYNSWESFFDKDAKGRQGTVKFTIYESDYME